MKTKLEPMRRPLEMAKRIPTIWRRREDGEVRLAGAHASGLHWTDLEVATTDAELARCGGGSGGGSRGGRGGRGGHGERLVYKGVGS